MARERRVSLKEQVRWISAIAISFGIKPIKLDIVQAQNIARVNENILSFEDYLGLKKWQT